MPKAVPSAARPTNQVFGIDPIPLSTDQPSHGDSPDQAAARSVAGASGEAEGDEPGDTDQVKADENAEDGGSKPADLYQAPGHDAKSLPKSHLPKKEDPSG